MKKVIIVLLILISSFGLCTFASYEKYNPNRPEWNEFCPFGMENPQPVKIKFMDSVMDKYIKQDLIYWYQRKQDFERNLDSCDNLNDTYKNACYAKLRDRQNRLNSTYVSPEERYKVWEAKMQRIKDAMYQEPREYNVNIRHY